MPKILRLLIPLFMVLISLAAIASNFYHRHQTAFAPPKPVESAETNSLDSKLLVIAPHCDDEVLAVGGLIQQALARGNQVKVVIITNGDGFNKAAQVNFPSITSKTDRYLQLAKTRQQESIDGLKILGLEEKEIIFLGYPDKGLASLWSKNWDQDKPYFNSNTNSDHSPYFKNFTPLTPYTGWNLVKDLTQIITEYQPTDIYYPHPNDEHPDHWATNCFVKYILNSNKLEQVREHLYLVHRGMWPTSWALPSGPELVPPKSLTNLGTQWLEIPLRESEIQLKKASILAHQTQIKVIQHYLLSFARANELFGSYPDLPLQEGKKQLIIQDPEADLWKSKANAHGDITEVYGSLDEQKLSLEIVVRSLISNKVSYHLHLRFLEQSRPTKLVHLIIKDNQITFSFPSKDSWEIKDLKVTQKSNRLYLEIPLASLPQFEALYLNVESKKGRSLVDKTAWRMLKKVPN